MKDSEEQHALRLAIYGNIFFTVAGLGFAFYTASQAVLLDGVFSAIALVLAVVTLYISRLLQRPGNQDYPFGYAVFEPLLNLVKGLIIGLVMVVSMLRAIDTLLAGGHSIRLGGVLIYAVSATITCLAIALYMRNKAAHGGWPLVEVEVKNWFMDAVISGVVAGSFFLVWILEGTAADPWLNYVDPILVILISLFFLSIPFGIIRENWAQISGNSPPDDISEPVQRIIDEVLPNFGVNRKILRLAQIGRMDYLQLYVLLDGSQATSFDVHKMDEIRNELYQRLVLVRPNITLDIVFTHDTIWAQRAVTYNA